MRWFRRDPIFTEKGPRLNPREREIAAQKAARAARRARQSATMTARKAYRAYRADAGDRFMEWALWERFYRAAYRGVPANSDGSSNTGAAASGAAMDPFS